jgi:hypothetical protein
MAVALTAALTVALAALAGCGLIRAPGSTWGTPTGLASIRPQAPSPSTVPRHLVPVSALEDPRGKFFGLEVSGAPENMSPVGSVAAGLGVNPNLIGQYVAWGRPFDTMAAANAMNSGALYYMAWEPFTPSVASIARGMSDKYITRFARTVHAFGEPVAISFGHEMNGNWYPWGTTGTTPADFVTAWRHIYELFGEAGATNVIWVWNPNIVNPMPGVSLKSFWPGNSYVDWVGITGYFAVTGPHTFGGVYGPTMTEIRRFTTKPFFIAETAVETSSNELSSIRSLIGSVKDDGDVLGFVWFNYYKNGVDWTLDRPKARAAAAVALTGMPLVRLGQ